MDIKVGEIPRLNQGEPENRATSVVEAKVLAVRGSRQRRQATGRTGPERREGQSRDPIHGRVLVLMVPDSRVLPADLESSRYRVFLRFTKT